MAQHRQIQQRRNDGTKTSSHLEGSKKPEKYLTSKVLISSTNKSKMTTVNNANSTKTYFDTIKGEHRSEDQDSKRTLIKNQLYLIEQLQLENANLRNERDQLQLENEELKFQLQMISSSNILGQSGTAFNDDRQLERLAYHDAGNHSQMVTGNLPTKHHTNTRSKSCLPPQTGGNSSNEGELIRDHYEHPTVTSASSLATLTATPSRQPGLRIKSDLCQSLTNSDRNLVRPMKMGCHQLSEAKEIPCTRIQSVNLYNTRDTTNVRDTSKGKTNTSAVLDLRPNDAPNSLLKNSQIDFLMSIDHDENDEEITRSKLVQQLYGDKDKVHNAAITIQRAFRKYQICKRFRMITEQLRQTSKSSPIHSKTPLQHQKIAGDEQRIQDVCDNMQAATVPYVSGTTRAAARESLSQAASRLASGAVAATAKQVFHNGVAKSASCQQVASVTRGNQGRQTKTTIASTVTTNNNRSSQFKASSVVAAAINFQQLESMRKRQYRVGLNIFNKNPDKGISFLIAHSFIDCSPPYMLTSNSYYLSNQLHFIDKQQLTAHQQAIAAPPSELLDPKSTQTCRLCLDEDNLKRNVAHFLLNRKGLAKDKIGQYLGNLQSGFNQDVLRYYLEEIDFSGMQVDLAVRKFSSTVRMPGEAQKIERFVDYFAARYVQCQQTMNDFSKAANNDWNMNNPTTDQPDLTKKSSLTLLTKDEIFILTFAIIMLNTDLHSPSLKSTARMSAHQFINNLRGVFKSQTINEAHLIEIYERVKSNQITTTPDHVTHVMKVQQGLTTNNFQKKELPNLCVPYRRLVCFCRLYEVYDINKKERAGQHQREIFLFNDLLLITKLSRRPRASAAQQYTYRQSISLQGLYVQLFQSAHYNFGIRLCRRQNDEILIMLNARNELDQSRFVDDLNESIAEMDEMESIKINNLVDSIHLKHLERLKRHATLHASIRTDIQANTKSQSRSTIYSEMKKSAIMEDEVQSRENEHETRKESSATDVSVYTKDIPRLSLKYNSMSDLTNIANAIDVERSGKIINEDLGGQRRNRSHVQQSRLQALGHQVRSEAHMIKGPLRSVSTNSVRSLDSGMFLSRDASPNQSA